MIAITDSLSDLASSDDQEDGDDYDDEERELGKLSEDEEPSWVVDTTASMVLQRMGRFRQMQMKLDELTQPGWGDTADYCCERDNKYGITKLKVPAAVKLQTTKVTAAFSPTTFGELMESPDVVPGELPTPEGSA